MRLKNVKGANEIIVKGKYYIDNPNEYKGNWVIKSLPCSPKSENFWNKTINKYTDGNFELEHIGKYNRAVFKFNNAK